MMGKLRTMDDLMAKVVKSESGCWEWSGLRTWNGYSVLSGKSPWMRTRLAHRLIYEHLVGPIPDGLVIDHLCRNRGCVNPAHMEVVTNAENMRRGERAQRTHCPKGHPYDDENTIRAAHGRACRVCAREQKSAWKRRYFEKNGKWPR